MKSYISFAYLQGLLLVTLYPILSFIIVPKEAFFPPLEIIPYAIISGGTSILAYLLMYYGLTKYDASTATPIIGVKAIFVVPLSYIFLGEFYGSSVMLWILITMFGAIMTSWDKNTEIKQILSPKNKALWIFLTVAFLYAAGNVAVKPAMAIVSNFNFLIWREFAWFGVLLALMPIIFHKKEQKSLLEDWKGAIGIPNHRSINSVFWLYFIVLCFRHFSPNNRRINGLNRAFRSYNRLFTFENKIRIRTGESKW